MCPMKRLMHHIHMELPDWSVLAGHAPQHALCHMVPCNFCLLLVFKYVLVEKAPKPKENQGGNMPINKELCAHYYLFRNLVVQDGSKHEGVSRGVLILSFVSSVCFAILSCLCFLLS